MKNHRRKSINPWREASLNPKRGKTVRFNPPAGAYSAASAQAQMIGKTGVLMGGTDEYAVVHFPDLERVLTIQTAYLEGVHG